MGITEEECYGLMQDVSLYSKYISVDEMTFGLIAVKHNIIQRNCQESLMLTLHGRTVKMQ